MGRQEWVDRSGSTGVGRQEWVDRSGSTGVGRQEIWVRVVVRFIGLGFRGSQGYSFVKNGW